MNFTHEPNIYSLSSSTTTTINRTFQPIPAPPPPSHSKYSSPLHADQPFQVPFSASSHSSSVPSSSRFVHPTLENIMPYNRIGQIINSILSIISFKAFKTLIELETKCHVNQYNSFTSERMDFFTKLINMSCNSTYTKRNVCTVHNMILIDREVRDQLFDTIQLETLISDYTISHPLTPFEQRVHVINISPFVFSCTNPACHQSSLEVKYFTNGFVVLINSIQPCSIYTASCPSCQYAYGATSILDTRENCRIVDIHSIRSDFVHFSGAIVFSREILTLFSNSLVHAHTTFEGFAESYLSTIAEIKADQPKVYSTNAFAKHFKHAWICYEVSRLVFLTSKESSFRLPRSKGTRSMSVFIERNLPFLAHIFTVFRSRH